jgi:hypothetical protein
VKVELAGTPATVVITEPFASLIASNAVKLGAPGYHFVALPHPVWSRSEEELRELVGRIVEPVLAQIADGRAL